MLRDKFDSLREKQWQELPGIQKEQLAPLATLIEKNAKPTLSCDGTSG